MQFRHIDRASNTPISGRDEAVLIDDAWDDYTFKTLFELVVFTDDGTQLNLGGVKILSRGMESGRVSVPRAFESLGDDYCSLGQDENYYETLAGLPKRLGEKVLRALRDCVQDPNIHQSFRGEKGFTKSLMRSLSDRTVEVTFASALGGQAPLTPFHFTYTFPPRTDGSPPPTATFEVDPSSMPPTNVHVIIGPNGAGKTRMLGNITDKICQPKSVLPDKALGEVKFVSSEGATAPGARFSNLITVTFSAFDPFRAPEPDAKTKGDIRYAYVGLKRSERSPGIVLDSEFKASHDLVSEFAKSLKLCSSGPRLRRWHEAIRTLETDRGIEELDLRSLLPIGAAQSAEAVVDAFATLSSGHKIVLLTMTRLVELVEQRTLVLIDEPEAHLHPPLLSSFVRALSTLLKRRNAVAIVATHSPVVLQETPRRCVWVLRRSGELTRLERPSIETFGENVGVLTRDVFGLEVTESGFHKLIDDQFSGVFSTNYDAVLEAFGGELGTEARAIVRALSRTVG